MDDQQKYEGMSVNERLYEAGLLAEFDSAVARYDIARVREILESICVDEGSIKSFLERIEGGKAL